MIKQEDLVTDWKAYLATAAGGLVVLLGVIVMLGWVTHTPVLIQLRPQLVPMQFNTALCFVFVGTGLILLCYRQRRVAFYCGVLVLGVSLLTQLEYFFGFNLGLDRLFIEPFVLSKTTYPGRMALATTFTFLLSGIGLVTATIFATPACTCR